MKNALKLINQVNESIKVKYIVADFQNSCQEGFFAHIMKEL